AIIAPFMLELRRVRNTVNTASTYSTILDHFRGWGMLLLSVFCRCSQPVLAQCSRLGRGNKSAAIWGTPEVLLKLLGRLGDTMQPRPQRCGHNGRNDEPPLCAASFRSSR